MEFLKLVLLLLCNRPEPVHVSQLGVELREIAGECSSWRHWLVDLCRAGYLESPRRGWYRITEAGQRFCSECCVQFERARRFRAIVRTRDEISVTSDSPKSLSESDSEPEPETDSAAELLEMWQWAGADETKIERMVKKLLRLKSISPQRVREICAEMWGAIEEIPPKLLDKFERAVEETLELLRSRG